MAVPWVGVALFWAPWPQGFHSLRNFGGVSAEVFLRDDAVEVGGREEAWGQAEQELLAAFARKAEALGANAIAGIEVTADPFEVREECVGLGLHAGGVAVLLAEQRR